uniref:4-hydroxyphenylpyruvate dioxygenase n=1 Tax=Aceria tosichella TaxID=561515 RepID=A0A6G1S7M2_9ACAR
MATTNANGHTNGKTNGANGHQADKEDFLLCFDHITFWVSNAKQVATYYSKLFGMVPFAYRGLETNSRKVASHVVKQNDIVFQFESALEPGNTEHGNYLTKHGDAVKDIALNVVKIEQLVEHIKGCGGKVVDEVHEVRDKLTGNSVKMARVNPYGDFTHTLIERGPGYEKAADGHFLPNYGPSPLAISRPSADTPDAGPGLEFIDHAVSNQPDHMMEEMVDWYVKNLNMRRFWSVDDSQIHTEYSSLRSVVVTNQRETIKMPINEPAQGLRKSQIQEFVEYHGEGGIQHIALHTSDIVHAVRWLSDHGVQFINTPNTYYDQLEARLKTASVKVQEDLKVLRELKILIDYDDQGYLLQLFTKPLEDRPTLFIEIIQRRNHNGFGVGNFKSLFESIEAEQKARGNL